MGQPQTLSEKVWDRHVVRSAAGEPDLIYVDLFENWLEESR